MARVQVVAPRNVRVRLPRRVQRERQAMQEKKIRTPAEDLPPPRPPWIRVVAMLGVGLLLIATLYGVWQAVA